MTQQHHPVIETILGAIKLARELYSSGVIPAGKAVLDALVDGIEHDMTADELDAHVKAKTDEIAVDDASLDARIRRVEEKQRLARGTDAAFDHSEDETKPGAEEP